MRGAGRNLATIERFATADGKSSSALRVKSAVLNDEIDNSRIACFIKVSVTRSN
jgi:hypothetical protein